MKRRTLVSIVCVIAALCFGTFFVGCNKHTHTFSSEWSSNAEYHWHAATCEHTEEKSDYAKHTFRASGVCIYCDYVREEGGNGGSGNGGSGNGGGQSSVEFTTEPSKIVALPTNVDVIYENMMLSKIAGGSYMLVGVEGTLANATEITVPEQALGADITVIADQAFSGNTRLVKITLSDKITHIGNQAFYNCSALEEVVLGTGLRTIDNYAFNSCPNLKTINFPEGLVSIGEAAFVACTSIETIVLPTTLKNISQTAFAQCEALTSISIPDSLETIGNFVFYMCGELTEVVLPADLIEMGYCIFAECPKLESVTMPYIGFDHYDSYFLGFQFDLDLSNNLANPAVSNSAIPASLKTVTLTNCYQLADGAFAGCSNIETINLPDNLVYVGENAFDGCAASVFTESNNGKYVGSETNPYLVFASVIDKTATTLEINQATKCVAGGSVANCENLTTVRIYDDVTSVGINAFAGVPTRIFTRTGNTYYLGTPTNSQHVLIKVQGNPASYTFTDSVKVVAGGAFKNSSALTSITIPNGITTVGGEAFYNCVALTSVTIADSVAVIGEDAFYGCKAVSTLTAPAYATLELAESTATFRTVNLTSGTFVPAYSFHTASALTSVTLADSITKIAEYAFYQCTLLTEIDLPSNLVAIGDRAFTGNVSLTTIELPTTLKTIGAYAFSGCQSLGGALILPDSVESIGERAFDQIAITQLYMGSGIRALGQYALGYMWFLADVTVSPENPNYYSVNNCLIEVGTGYLVIGGETADVPTDGSVIAFGDLAFYGRSQLANITISEHVTYIGYGCFAGCVDLFDIHYQGTRQQWNAITFADLWDYIGRVGTYKVYFSDGTFIETEIET